MNHQQMLQQEQESARQAQKQAERSRQMYLIFKNHPELINCQANEQAISNQLGDDLTLEAYEHDFTASAEFRAKLALQTLEQAAQRAEKTKRNLVNKIVSEMCVSPDSANAVAKQLFYLSIPELERRLREIEEKQRLAALPKEEVRQIVKQDADTRRANLQRKYPFIPLDTQAREIKRMSLKELKELVRVYGQAQVDARLNSSDHQLQKEFLEDGFHPNASNI